MHLLRMKRVTFLVICMGAVALLFGIAGAALASEGSASIFDPITHTEACSPRSIPGPQKVEVTISITNQAKVEVPVVLLGPGYTQLNTYTLEAGATVTYTGQPEVTEAELKDGKIMYYLDYRRFMDIDGHIASEGSYDYAEETEVTTVPFSVPISKSSSSSASASLKASYSITPQSASRGQTVTLVYTLTNDGEADVVDVAITNTNLGKDSKVSIPRIGAGETVIENYQYTMGGKAVTSRPKVQYKPEGGGEKDAKTLNLDTEQIKFDRLGVTANLKSLNKTEVQPGTEIELSINLANTSNVTYKNVRVSNPELGDIASGIELKSGNGKVTETKKVTVAATKEYIFYITGASDDGKELNITSNIIRATALDMNKQLQFDIQASTETLEIYEEPAEIDFLISVRNTGATTGTELNLMHGKTKIAEIGTMAPGEERVFAKRLLISMHGEFGFSVAGLNGQGLEQTVTQKPEEKLYVAFAEPTPTPAPTRAPTEIPVETEVPIASPTEDKSENGMTLLWVLAGVLMVALLAVLGVIAVGRRQQAQEEAKSDSAIDSIQRGSRRDYTSKHKPIQDAPRGRRDVQDDGEGEEYGVDYDKELAELSAKSFLAEGTGLAEGLSMSELAAKYGRPDQEEEPTPRKRKHAVGEPAAKTERKPHDDLSDGGADEPGEPTRRRRARAAGA